MSITDSLIDEDDHSNLKVLLRCPVCLDQYSDPRMLPCQHSFCLTCLEKVSDDRWGRCPVCRQLFRIPFNGGVSSLDVNRTIVSLIESCSNQKRQLRTALEAKCSDCKNEGRVKACGHCREALCASCREDHYRKLSRYLSNKLSEVHQEASNLSEVNCVDQYEKNIQNSDKVANDISEKITKITTKLNMQKDALIGQLESYKKEQCLLINSNKEKLKELENIKEFCLRSKEDLQKKKETDEDVLIIIKKCEDYVIKTKELEKAMIMNSNPFKMVTFYERDMTSDDIFLGFVQFGKPVNPVPFPVRMKVSKSPTWFPESSFNHKSFGKKGTKVGEFRYPLGLSSWRNLIFVTDTWNNRIQIWAYTDQSTLVPVESHTHPLLLHPFSIHVVHSGHKLYIIDNSSQPVKVFDRSLRFLRVIPSEHASDIDTDKSGNVYILNPVIHRLIVYSSDGECIRSWGNHGSGPGEFKCPVAVAIHEEKVYVSDWGNKRIQVFSLLGDTILVFLTWRRPGGIAVDLSGRIFVVDAASSAVRIHTKDGAIQHRMQLSKSSCRLWDVVILSNGNPVTSDYGSHQLRLL